MFSKQLIKLHLLATFICYSKMLAFKDLTIEFGYSISIRAATVKEGTRRDVKDPAPGSTLSFPEASFSCNGLR